jgi:DNA-binding protein Fis
MHGDDMGAILLIEDDKSLKGLIEKIVGKKDLKVLKDFPENDEPTLESRGDLNSRVTDEAGLEEDFRKYLQKEISAGRDGNIFDSVIGKTEKALIGIVLEEEKGNQVRAAKRLGINRNTLRKKMRDLRILTRVVTI